MVRRRHAPSQGEPSVRAKLAAVGRVVEAQPHAPPARPLVVSPGSDLAMCRLGIVIRGRDGLTDEPRRIILDPSAASDRPAPPPPRHQPRSLPSHQGRGTCPTVAGASSAPMRQPGVNQSHPGCAGQRPLWQVPSWHAIAANWRLVWAPSAASQQAPANHERWRPLAWTRDEAMTSMREAKRLRFYFPSTTAAGHVHQHHHHGRPRRDDVKISREISCVPGLYSLSREIHGHVGVGSTRTTSTGGGGSLRAGEEDVTISSLRPLPVRLSCSVMEPRCPYAGWGVLFCIFFHKVGR